MENESKFISINDKMIKEAEVKSSLTIEQYFKIKDKFYNVSSDPGFKYVLSDPYCLSGFLTLLVGKTIKPEMLHYCNIENVNDNKSSIRTDLLVYVDLDDQLIRIFINLEMQNKYNHDLNKRMFNYLSSVLQKNISIDKELVYQSYWIMPGSETKHYDFDNSFIYDIGFRHKDKEFLPHKINIVDLNRMAKCGNIILEELAVLFFAKNKDEIDGIKTKLALKWRKRLMELNNDFLTKYAEFVKESHEQDKIAQRKYDDEQLIAESKAEGKTEKAIDIARNMLNKGADINFISECTGLSINEIEKLIK